MIFLPLLVFCSSAIAATPPYISPNLSIEAYASRTYFYAGGHYENVSFGEVMTGQMYVEKLVPQAPTQKYPLVFITGAGQTSTNFLNTPDGRPGWASYFLSKGYTLYLTDQPQRGRSPWVPGEGTMTMYNVTFIEGFFTAPQIAKRWPQASLHTQWPGKGIKGDPVFDAFLKGEIQQQSNDILSETLNVLAGLALLDKIGPAILITHSHSGPYGWGIADRAPDLVKGVVALEPEGPPFVQEVIRSGPARPFGITTLPLTYDPAITNATELVTETVTAIGENRSSCVRQVEPARQLSKLKEVPVLVVSSEASYHAVYDYCTVGYLRQAGVGVDWLDLPSVGIHGNAHFMFMELNNMEIVPLVEEWIDKEKVGHVSDKLNNHSISTCSSI